MTSAAEPPFGIVAGGGALPRLLAERLRAERRAYRVFGVQGAVDPWVAVHPTSSFRLEELDDLFSALARHGVRGGLPGRRGRASVPRCV